MSEEYIIKTLLNSVAPTLGNSAGNPILGVATPTSRRYGVTVRAYAAAVYVKAVNKGASAPTLSATDFHWPIPANTSWDKKLGDQLDIYVYSTGNYSLQEWQG